MEDDIREALEQLMSTGRITARCGHCQSPVKPKKKTVCALCGPISKEKDVVYRLYREHEVS